MSFVFPKVVTCFKFERPTVKYILSSSCSTWCHYHLLRISNYIIFSVSLNMYYFVIGSPVKTVNVSRVRLLPFKCFKY